MLHIVLQIDQIKHTVTQHHCHQQSGDTAKRLKNGRSDVAEKYCRDKPQMP